MAGPPAGVRVLALPTVILGPFATQVLAGLGAEVIKIESPEGDDMRHVVPLRGPGTGHVFLPLHPGPKTRAPPPGRPAYDDLVQGTAGMSWLLQQYTGGEPGYVPVPLADRVTGLHAVYAVCAALYARERTGRGPAVGVPVFEAMAQCVLGDHMGGLTFVPPLGEPGYARLLTPNRRPYRTKDGYLCVLIYNDKQWRSFFAAIGDPEGMDRDPRFSTHTNPAAAIDEVYAWVAETMRTRTTAEWRELLEKADIPHAPMNSPADLLADPELAVTGFLTLEDHPTEGRLHVMGTPTDWSKTQPDDPTPAPRLGENSATLLAAAGYSEEEIRAMAAAGATRRRGGSAQRAPRFTRGKKRG